MDSELMNVFRRAAALSRRQRRERKKTEGMEGCVRGMGHILETLSLTEGKRQKELASEVGIRPSSLSEAIALLEKRGEIKKERSPEDGRVTMVYLTEKGAEKRNAMREARRDHAKNFFSPLTPQEKEELKILLEKIVDCFEERRG